MKTLLVRSLIGIFLVSLMFSGNALSQERQTITIDGSDAIFLAGRSDVSIPPADQPWNGPGTFLARHSSPTPEEILETVPAILFGLSSGDVIRAFDPATGGVSFFNGIGDPFFGPSGNGVNGSSLSALDGISGYIGPQGPLTGVFLDDTIPSSGPAPETLNFSDSGIGIDFAELTPQLNQVFYIGDGVDSSGLFQRFIAPAGTTRLALGIPDGFGFGGIPGAYDDNDGSYQIRIGVNVNPVPEPGSTSCLIAALILRLSQRRRITMR